MRIITGTARGRRLQTLPGEDTRPTTDRVKEGIFSAIQFDIEGRRVLDLFAGSGQMGLEALSRGASRAVFVDKSPKAADVIRANCLSTGLADGSVVLCTDALTFCAGQGEKFDIIFLDPPYDAGLLPKILPFAAGCLSDYGMLVCEHRMGDTLPDKMDGIERGRCYRYGKIMVTFYRKGGEIRDAGKECSSQ